jgi:hypothetical protein
MVADFATFPIWMFILIVGLHFWFNMKIGKHLYGFIYMYMCLYTHLDMCI